MKLPYSRIRVITFTVVAVGSLLILSLLYALTYTQINASLNTSNKLMHAGNIELELERLLAQIKYAEAAQRGFLLTNDSTFLQPFEKSKHRIASSLNTLREFLINDSIQTQNLNKLEELVNKRFNLLSENIQIVNTIPKIPDSLKRRLDMGNIISELSTGLMSKMITFQDNNLKALRTKHVESIISTSIIYFSIVLITLSVFSFLLLKQITDRKKLVKINDELSITNHSFAQAEQLAGLGNWRHNFQTGVTTYSDNFYRLLGMKPQTKQLSLKEFLSMVHPSDRKEMLEQYKHSIRNQQPLSTAYRLNTKDGKIKHFKSVGRIYKDNNNQQYIIGINMDITEVINNNRLLEIKNRKLELFNADLASFNYVASHDLQAPLRKIQMFISRISDMEFSNLSDQGKEYFTRIHASAAHMQTLINDLLMFSRTNAANKRFEPVNLNELLNNAIDELIIQIDEKKAKIIYENLPVIPGIPYQIQQLFTNLISNSLKFSRDNIQPIIQISSEIINKEYLNFDDEYMSDTYYKISFSDNGIGFEKQYAEKIFNLLFRLHDKKQFPGSGIGLAICKKIVENHHGFIQAESELEQGAKFLIYLPTNLPKH